MLIHAPETGCHVDTYENEIEIFCFPALVAKFPNRLDEIAKHILNRFHEAGDGKVRPGMLSFEEHVILFAGDPGNGAVGYCATADLAILEPTGDSKELNGEMVPVYMPMPAHTVTGRG